ncbi:GNAT family N-acetyltransferase [Paenibacillus sp. KQZ6P-2]|uniref:GNAT family N-acetyltransferase n=1 Tax=Paenibacillus mangrovi TaxID=2931978 RepID=A0A9X1WKR7_9BACL|nr:GNAT family N-acetyltransferase [Paenibacillus mangrovi]MCJ8010521.1 GNAT family N-acetyltransferase [Paenibacillus mangrovi]
MRIGDQSGDQPLAELSASLQLEIAEFDVWKKFWSIYYDQGSVGFSLQTGPGLILPVGTVSYWVKNGSNTIGGVIVSSNAIRCLFTIPPFQADAALVRLLSRKMQQLEGSSGTVHACDILPDQEDLFIRAGFRPDPHRYRWMQRPTAEFVHPPDHHITLRTPNMMKEDGEQRLLLEREIGLFLFKHANEVAGAAGFSFSEVLAKLRRFAALSPEDALQASSLMYDTRTRALIGVCLIDMEEGCPTIDELAVMPAYRSRGLATRMLQHALSELEKRGQPLLRIRVMHGHPLESLCFHLGFMPGPLFIPLMTLYGMDHGYRP